MNIFPVAPPSSVLFFIQYQCIMVTTKTVADFLRGGYKAFLPHHSVDCVIFGFHGSELKLLLLKWKHLCRWSLPGGFIKPSESMDEAAHRILKERTGLDHLFLQQFYTFGALDRHEDVFEQLTEALAVPITADFWPAHRVISTGYYALVDFSTVKPMPDPLSEECRWWDVTNLPALLFDHDQMVEKALKVLRMQLNHQPVGLNLLPETFTMPELQAFYETILGRTLDRRNFQKKILGLGIVERLEKRRTGKAHRAPYLYRFDVQKYNQALGDGLSFGF